ncbi:sulfotransferase [Maricaulis sp.]|uniref:tetratricopeptide repeat-containing sulfotransferase family protein n=2 Tax=Maricaulis sp. TaxID=1486257 RepID=UPI0032996D92
MDTAISPADPKTRLARIDQALRTRRVDTGLPEARALTSEFPDYIDGWLALARCFQMAGDHAGMREALGAALKLDPASPLARLMDAEALVHLGRVKEAASAFRDMRADADNDANWLARIGEGLGQCGLPDAALDCFDQALSLTPGAAELHYARATHLIAVGRLGEAEQAFDTAIRRAPHDYDAYYNRSTVRKQTPARNHVDELRRMLRVPHRTALAPVQLNFALAKELEDLGRDAESFEALKAGADARRAMMRYDVRGDVATMDAIAKRFDKAWLDAAGAGVEADGPVFILGLPRSGSTLTDRILSAHSEIESLGELNDFPLALTGLCRQAGGKAQLIDAAAALDPAALGTAYLERLAGRRGNARLFIDKAPANFLYIGLIAAALPGARIIHVHRDPMDNAYSLYKALFRMGYPYSYDFADLAAYMQAKDRLMTHWHAVLPGRVHDVRYEDIIADQDGETRRLLDAVGVPFEPACLDFHRNASPSATHSAAQVRQPLYSSSVGLWQRYAEQLAPLARQLGVS